MASDSQPNATDDEIEIAVDQAIVACGGNRATIPALIVASNFLQSEIDELKKAVSHAYVRGRYRTYSGWMISQLS